MLAVLSTFAARRGKVLQKDGGRGGDAGLTRRKGKRQDKDMTQYTFQTEETVLLAIYALLAISFAVDIYIYLRYYTGVLRRARAVRKGKCSFTEEKPPVSVIVCARDEGENLEKFLPLVLEQDYPEYEVIVVNDGSWDNSEEILDRYKRLYHNLYHTNIPNTTRVISRKKFALTVGIKAAKHEILLFTDAGCRPLSRKWIEGMARNFSEGTEFVLGYGRYAPLRNSLMDRITSRCVLLQSMRFLGYAYSGKPYTGTGINMAYRKSTFFSHKGFAGHLHVEAGADSLMVNEAGNAGNTKIETSPETVTAYTQELTWKDRVASAEGRTETLRLFSGRNKRRMAAEPTASIVFYISFILAMVMTSEPWYIYAVVAMFIVRYAVQSVIVNVTAKRLGEKPLFLSILLYDILAPIAAATFSLSRRMRGRRHKFHR